MNHIDQQMLIDAVNAQDDEFVTHDIVRYLYTNHQHEYLEELNAHSGAPYPFTETHRAIGRALTSLKNLIDKAGKVPSAKTMRGKPTRVEKWKKKPRPQSRTVAGTRNKTK